jgi:hypothetical protein
LDWYYFGARFYDAEIGRFLSVDRFADKYPSLSPYVYCANNPLIFIDAEGDSIQITDSQTQQDFINTLPPEAQKYVRFSKSGMLDIDYLGNNTKGIKDINLRAANVIGKSKQLVFMRGMDKAVYKNDIGAIKTESMGIYKGFTFAPDGSKFQSSIDGVFDIQLNKSASDLKRAEFIGEELYGHTRFYIEGRKYDHDYREGYGGYDFNRPLSIAIQWHRSSSVINYVRSKRW